MVVSAFFLIGIAQVGARADERVKVSVFRTPRIYLWGVAQGRMGLWRLNPRFTEAKYIARPAN